MRRLWTSASLFLLIGVIAQGAITSADDTRDAVPPDIILRRFAVARGGECLCLPVNLGGKNRQFMIDTGASQTVVDTSLLVGKEVKRMTVKTGGGPAQFGLYALPSASVAGTPLRLDSVFGMDMTPLREVSGQPIEGVIGMDCLRSQILHIDFDRGEILFLRSVPAGAGRALPLIWNAGGCPEIDARATGKRKVRFLIDTGHVGFFSGTLNIREAKSLVGNGELRVVGSTLTETASGTISSPIVEGGRLTLSPFHVERPVFGEGPATSTLGLGFWSRYVVTFDFPDSKVYLREGKDYGRPDGWNKSGMHLLLKNGFVVVHSIEGQSPAEIAGVRYCTGSRRVKIANRESSTVQGQLVR